MQEFAEEYVANLQSRDERYDTRLGDDFYVSTFPNGVKTWIFLYEVNGFTRRQTLGVYPEMPLDRALEMLYAARRTRSVEKELIDQGLDGNSHVRQAEDSPIDLTAKAAQAAVARLPKPGKGFMLGAASGAVAGAVIAAGALWFLLPRTAPELSLAHVEPPQVSRPSPPPVPATGAVVPSPPSVAATGEVAPSPPVAVPGQVTASPQSNAPAVVAAVEPGPVAAAPVVAAPPVPAAEAPVALSDAGAPAPAPDGTQETQPLGESQRELMELQRDMAGTLAWSQLTSGIVRGEPVDDLGWTVEVSTEPRRVFFFVRVRGMSGATVNYRWSFEGAVIKRDTVRVGQGWHSPAFSSVTLTPEREGLWHVEVLDDEGRSLGVEQFETRHDRVAALNRN